MGRKRKEQGQKEPKRTPTKVQAIPRKSGGKLTEPWAILERLLADHAAFQQIRHCRVKLWWQKDPKVDADGIATGATVCKANEIDRNLSEESAGGESLDIFIKLARDAWQHYPEKKKEQVIFHELCHVHPARDGNGEQKQDTKGRLLWRIGRHPISTFHEELSEYGAEAVIGNNQAVLDAMRAASAPLLAEAEKNAKAREAIQRLTPKQRAESVGALPGITSAVIDMLNTANIGTLGELHAALIDDPEWWFKKVKGLGGERGAKIVDAFHNYMGWTASGSPATTGQPAATD
jgi:hypothetical protein